MSVQPESPPESDERPSEDSVETDEVAQPNPAVRRRAKATAASSPGVDVAESENAEGQKGSIAAEPEGATSEVPSESAADATEGQASDKTSLDSLIEQDPELLGADEHEGKASEDPNLNSAESDAVAADLNADFASLLESAGGVAEIKPGQRIQGTIVSISGETVFVDVGGKSEASLDRRELLDEDGTCPFKPGDSIEAQVIRASAEELRLSYGALKAHRLSEFLEDAVGSKVPVEGKVVGFNDGGLEVRIGGRRAFCPRSQVDLRPGGELSSHVGKTYNFLVTQFEKTGRNLVVSRRSCLELESKEKLAETMGRLEPGALFSGTVRKIMPFGVFVDLGGVDGLVHISELSWGRVEDPSEVVSEGQEVQVKVLGVDEKSDRISLSLRQAGDDPWSSVSDQFSEGQSVTGKVTRLADFGAFVEVDKGIEGLVHVSEIDWNRRINHPREVLKVGDEVSVAVLEVDTSRKRISLSIKQAGDDPWSGLGAEVKKGAELDVVVEKVADFGVFCVVAPGVTGLLPNSHTVAERGANLRREFRPGKSVRVQVIEMDKKRRKITLSMRALDEAGGGADLKAYKKQLDKQQDEAPSAFALAFAAANEKKKKN
ncbi:MAG TPA: 30S ribosomal protein S1 [Deltaproteobacteria bacterium]|nr:30S ribosomal protein S1 [Deltaproteobacteria bacterium]HCP44594.1 30S ribosomal protein S1 [Deltaproteobacteria bacterium]